MRKEKKCWLAEDVKSSRVIIVSSEQSQHFINWLNSGVDEKINDCDDSFFFSSVHHSRNLSRRSSLYLISFSSTPLPEQVRYGSNDELGSEWEKIGFFLLESICPEEESEVSFPFVCSPHKLRHFRIIYCWINRMPTANLLWTKNICEQKEDFSSHCRLPLFRLSRRQQNDGSAKIKRLWRKLEWNSFFLYFLNPSIGSIPQIKWNPVYDEIKNSICTSVW